MFMYLGCICMYMYDYVHKWYNNVFFAFALISQTRTVWKQVQNQNLSCIAFINKMDREGANFAFAVSTLQTKLGVKAIPIQLPVMKNDIFCGVIDVVGMRSILWDNNQTNSSFSNNTGASCIENITLSHDKYDDAMAERVKLIEKIADVDDIFAEIFLNTEVELISEQDIMFALRRCCVSGQLVPTLCGASLKSKGVQPLLDAISRFVPSPLDRHACYAKHNLSGKTKEIQTTGKELVAFAFKVIVDPNRGPLVFIRNFSGEIPSKSSTLWNISKKKKERPHQLLKVSADELLPTESIGRGDIGCIVGLKHTVTGDTLVLQKEGSMHEFELEGKQ